MKVGWTPVRGTNRCNSFHWLLVIAVEQTATQALQWSLRRRRPQAIAQQYHDQRQISSYRADDCVSEQEALPANIAELSDVSWAEAEHAVHKATRATLGARAAGVGHGVFLPGANRMLLAAVTSRVPTLANGPLAGHPVATRRTAATTPCHTHARVVVGILNTS